MENKDQYTDDELHTLEVLKDDLIIWMFHKPNDSYPILETLKRAYNYGKEYGSQDVGWICNCGYWNKKRVKKCHACDNASKKEDKNGHKS